MKIFKHSLTVVTSFMLGMLTILLFQCDIITGNTTDQICNSYSSETFGEDLTVFSQSVERYSLMHGAAVRIGMENQGIKLDPSQICSIPFETMKKFLHFLELYSKNSGIKTEDLVIPIYYAIHKYDSTTQLGGLHTAYMGAAVNIDGQGAVPFDPRLTFIKSQNRPTGGPIEIVELKDLVLNQSIAGSPQTGFLLPIPLDPYLRNQFFVCPTFCPPQFRLLLDEIHKQTTASYPLINYRLP